MDITQLIPDDTVRKTCQRLGLPDWTRLDRPPVSLDDARRILEDLEGPRSPIDLQDFQRGLEIELHHGRSAGRLNCTNNHPLLTGMLVLSHLAQDPGVYRGKQINEVETILTQAVATGDGSRIGELYSDLVDACRTLVQDKKSNFE